MFRVQGRSRRRSYKARLSVTRKVGSQFKTYEPEKELGHGVTGTVFQVKDKFGESKAMKTVSISKLNTQEAQELTREIQILETLDHPNIVRLLETFQTRESVTVIMDLCQGGSLVKNGQSRVQGRQEKAAEIIYQVLLAIKYMHTMHLVHRDIKLDNILFVSEDPTNLDVRVIDFGFSTSTKKRNLFGMESYNRILKTTCGTYNYMAPEMFKKEYGKEVDIWSVGVVAYALATGKQPFPGATEAETIRKVKQGEVDMDYPIFDENPKLREFIENVLVKDRKKRWTVQQCLDCKWMKPCRDKLRKSIEGKTSAFESKLVESLKKFQKYDDLKKYSYLLVAHFVPSAKLQQIYSVFKALNLEGTGTLTFEEFQSFLSQHQVVSMKDVKSIFSSMDFDRNGKIRLTEFIAAGLEAIYSGDGKSQFLSDAFELLSQGNSFVNLQLLNSLLGRRNARKIAKALRKTQSDDISKAEFLTVLSDGGGGESKLVSSLN